MATRLSLQLLLVVVSLSSSLSFATTIVINEVNADQPGPDSREFVELMSAEENTSLDGFILVFFDGKSQSSYLTVSLEGFRSDENGHFVIGMPEVTPKPALVIDGPISWKTVTSWITRMRSLSIKQMPRTSQTEVVYQIPI